MDSSYRSNDRAANVAVKSGSKSLHIYVRKPSVVNEEDEHTHKRVHTHAHTVLTQHPV